jgi:HKD family nuclease
MEIKFTDNITSRVLDILKPSILSAKEIKFGVAFAKYSGFSLIAEDIKTFLKEGGKAEFIFGLDFRTTEPKVLKILDSVSKEGFNIKLFCFSDPSTDDTPTYHPKIYLLKKRGGFTISIDSSNLTAGGLKNNVEVNAVIEAGRDEELVSDIYGIYNRFKFQKNRFEPDLAYIENYEEAYEIIRKKNIYALREKNTRKKIKELKEREKILPKPKPTKAELFGWQKIVYERLPEGIFRTRDMYTYEKEFQQVYPENRHVTDKIRQILQQLRDLGLLRYIDNNRWAKI